MMYAGTATIGTLRRLIARVACRCLALSINRVTLPIDRGPAQCFDDTFQLPQALQELCVGGLPGLARGATRRREDAFDARLGAVGAWMSLVALDFALPACHAAPRVEGTADAAFVRLRLRGSRCGGPRRGVGRAVRVRGESLIRRSIHNSNGTTTRQRAKGTCGRDGCDAGKVVGLSRGKREETEIVSGV